MTFGQAIELCTRGNRVFRAGWNGKGQYVELATCISYVNVRGETVNGKHALALVGTNDVQVGWAASQADMLANDWEVR